jgi:hypothetical protein
MPQIIEPQRMANRTSAFHFSTFSLSSFSLAKNAPTIHPCASEQSDRGCGHRQPTDGFALRLMSNE